MKLSRYLKIWPYPQEPGYSLLYSTKRASLVLLPDEEIKALQNGKSIGDNQQTLIELEMLVADLDDERDEVFSMMDEINLINPNLSVTIILGMECNFACTYCYEGSQKGKAAISDETADRIIEFVKNRFTADKLKLTLDFYCGEPLIYQSRIKYFASKLKPFVEARGGEFNFTLVTNGSLLTRKTAEELARYGLTNAKITVDGPSDNHNKFRPFKNGAASFDIILNNISQSWDLVKITLGGNFTRENYQDFPQLLDHLEGMAVGPKQLHQVNFNPVMQVNDEFAGPECHGGCESINEPWLVEASTVLNADAIARGFASPKVSPSPCMVDVNDAFVVHYDGVIYKCPSLIGHDQFAVGDIEHGVGDYRHSHNLDSWKKQDECTDCQYLPLCFGGCRYYKFQRDGHLNGVDCQRPYWDAALETLVKQGIGQC
ncbi:MAG: geopeptide radical SAM maturase [Proteobacteria bacterium]|nr:geopeptide radical SAM maturase [Pseudomonadota bacterium]